MKPEFSVHREAVRLYIICNYVKNFPPQEQAEEYARVCATVSVQLRGVV